MNARLASAKRLARMIKSVSTVRFDSGSSTPAIPLVEKSQFLQHAPSLYTGKVGSQRAL
jgi:hypothetical protein